MSEYRGAYVVAIRGGAAFYQRTLLVGKTTKEYTGESGLCARVTEAEAESFFCYAKTFVARAGLMLSKYNHHNDGGELATVPLVPFDRHWTDEDLAAEIGLTEEELTAIRAALPDYHGLL